jgi:hypothetical protein
VIEGAEASRPLPSGPGIPNINAVTGLSTDYLNHFNEAIMALEMATAMPEFLDDLRLWRPKTYAEHFAASRFGHRDAAIHAYRTADPAVRAALDRVSESLNAALVRRRDAMIAQPPSAAAGTPTRRVLAELRPLIDRIAAVINGSVGAGSQQAAIDAMFGR